jgi:hypothetical protein
VGFFWRLGHADGIYSLSGRLLRSGRGSDARYVSTEFSLNVTWQIDPNMSLTGIYAHSVPGALWVFNDDVVASPRKPLRKPLWGCPL